MEISAVRDKDGHREYMTIQEETAYMQERLLDLALEGWVVYWSDSRKGISYVILFRLVKEENNAG